MLNTQCIAIGLGVGLGIATVAYAATPQATATNATVKTQAAAVQMNLKPGRWEVTRTAKSTSGSAMSTLSAEDLANLTPAQRTKMQVLMQAAATGGGVAHTYQSCLTEKDLKDGNAFEESKDQLSSCTNKIVTNTATNLTVQHVCTSGNEMNVTVSFTAKSPQAVAGTVAISASGGGFSSTSDVSAKWIDADCSKIKSDDE
jgi:Protein of unknown function (DUF3617)